MQIFPKWVNTTPILLAAAAPAGLVAVVGLIWYYFSPRFTDVGYQPTQPVPYSHKLHAGELGIDCQYCHYGVEKHARANVPPTQVCINCHKEGRVKGDSPKLAKVRESFETGKSVEWIRIHKIPDHAQFTHAPHVQAGVGCVECHGRIDQMPVVAQQEPLSMGWCLECHRKSKDELATLLRPTELVTKMDWEPNEAHKALATARVDALNPPQHCSGCHR